MKKVIVLICLSFTFLFSTHSVFAQENISSDGAVLITNPTPTPDAPDGESAEAQLPYPGILPDSPWYKFRVLIDQVFEILIDDPLKKPRLDLFYANKRLNAGIFLLNQKDGDDILAIRTISKGENYLADALKEAQDAKKLGMDISDILDKLSTTAIDHRIIIHDLQENSYSQGTKESLHSLEKRVEEFQKQVESLRKK